jgi:DNA recombination protein RmuC
MDAIALFLLVVVCLAAGGAVGWLAARSRTAAETARLQATLDATRVSEQRLEQSLRTVSADALAHHSAEFARLVAPLTSTLWKVEQQVAAVERDRVDAYAGLREQVREVHATSEQLRTETRQLVTALRAPQVRGRWGEHQLRRIVEAAGLLEHCDFTEQAVSTTEEGTLRPDMVVTLAGGKHVVVDSKVPFNAYLEAMEARDEAARGDRLTAHARALRGHVDALSAKSYWSRFDPSPEFVVLFVPADTFLDAALQRDATLLEHAFARDVVLATPSTLIALLRTIAYTWRQEALAQNAAEVHALGRELHSRLATMGGHLTKVGTSLNAAVGAYNSAVGSLEGRVLVTARRFADLHVTTAGLEGPRQVETAARQPQAAELVASATDALVALDERARDEWDWAERDERDRAERVHGERERGTEHAAGE